MWCGLQTLMDVRGQYHFVIQLVVYVVIAPYMSTARWRADFLPPALHRPVVPAWCASPTPLRPTT